MKKPPWEVLLFGGASGVGKTSVSYKVAHHFGVGISEVDDFQVVLEKLTTPEQQPVLHYWSTQLQFANPSVVQIVEQTIAVARVMAPALEAVIANHLETNIPVVLEGDFILPTLAAQNLFEDIPNQDRVRGIFLYEPDESQIVANYLRREPEHGEQKTRAQVSWLYGEWLREEAEKLGIMVIPSRPWDTLLERLIAYLQD